MTLGVLAALSAAAFFGAAIYVLFVENAARAALDDRAALAEWKPAYKRGAIVQGSTVLVAAALGLSAWLQNGHWAFLVGAVLAFLPWPWTLVVIRPTNNRLLTMSLEQAGVESRSLLSKWVRLHAVRTAMGGLAMLAFLVALLPDAFSGSASGPSNATERFLGNRHDFSGPK